MSGLSSDHIGKLLSFTVYPVAILGSSFSNVTVLGLLDAASAFQFIDPAAMHVNVYPTLPVGVTNRYDSYLYAKLKLANGAITCVGLPWIDNSTIVVHSNLAFDVRIEDVDAPDYETLRNALLANGFNNFVITTVDLSA